MNIDTRNLRERQNHTMSEEPSASDSGSRNTSVIFQLKLKKVPQDTSVKEQDFIINQTAESTRRICDIFVKLKSAITKQNVKEFKNSINHLHLIDNKTLIQQYLYRNDTDLFCLISEYSQLEMLEYLIDQTELLPYLTPEKTKQSSNIKTILWNCMCNGNIGLLEKFYDHWAGDLHWVINKISSENDYKNLKEIQSLMNEVFQSYLSKEKKGINPQIHVDIMCIILFNSFQIELYDKLNEEKKRIHKWEATHDYDNTVREIQVVIKIIEITINLHGEYSKDKLDKFPLLSLHEDDKYTVYWRAQKFYMFKNFFWKSDYNVCLLILDNLYLLKERLKMSDKIYQHLESKLYYFIYNCKSKWSFFLSQTERFEVDTCTLGVFNMSYILDVGALRIFLILYLERDHFLEVLCNFKDELKKPLVTENVRLNRSEMTDDEQQSLIPFPEMRDDFSLKKMFRSLQELPTTNDIKQKTEWAQLVLERILQVLGEYIKSSKESKHLEATTQALLLAEIPIHVVNSLKAIRLFLSKSDSCQVLWRIEISKHGESLFEKVLQDLLHIKDIIKRVININRYLVNKSVIKCCYNVLNTRSDCIEKDIESILHLNFDSVSKVLGGILRMPTEYHGNPFLENFYESHWSKSGLSKDLMMEVAQLQHDRNMLRKKHIQEEQRIKTFLDKNYSFYKKVISSTLDKINFQKSNWCKIKLECILTQDDTSWVFGLSDYPNNEDLCIVRNNLNKSKENDTRLKHLTDLLNNVIDIKPCSELIERIFEFLIVKCKSFNETSAQIKYGMFTYFYNKIRQDGYKTDTMSVNVKDLLNLIETEGLVKVKTSIRGNDYKYKGIKEFEKILYMNQFITEDEMQYIIENLPNNQQIFYIRKNFLLDMKSHVTYIKSTVPFDKKSEQIIRSVNVNNRDPDLLKCYLKRLTSLSTLLNGQPKDLLVLRYKYIGQFKIWLEMLLIDIFNILKKCKKCKTLRKEKKLLTEINLRHVLTHGNPLLEVVGQFLDANDIPGEMIGKSLEFISDLESLQALNEMQENGFDFNYIHDDLDTFDKSHEKKLVETFRKAKQCDRYLSLLPEYYKHPTKPKTKKKKTTVTQELELIKAINANELIEKIKEIIERVDVDGTDKLGKAAIHYAATQGNVELLKLLIDNKADINITNKKENNWTALHYAARKGHKDAVNFVIGCGAEIKKDDQGDTYKDIEDKQEEISKKRVCESNESSDDLDDIGACFEALDLANPEIGRCSQDSADTVVATFMTLNINDSI